MKINVVMPQLGESIAEGEVTAWLKAVGDAVQRDESIAEVTTDKATVEIPAPASGVLSEVLVQTGEKAEVGRNIAVIESTGEQAATAVEIPDGQARERAVTLAPAPPAASVPTAPAPAPAAKRPPTPAARPPEAVRMTPLARRLARELGIDPAGIQGTGAAGRITREDILRVKAEAKTETRGEARPEPPAQSVPEAPVGQDDEVVPLSPMRRRIAARLLHSTQTIPHVTTAVEADMTAVDQLRRKHKAAFEKDGLKLTFLPFVMKATIDALKAFPDLNSSWGEDKLIRHKRVHLGVAVAVEKGLTVPVIRNADGMSVKQLTKRLKEVAEHARAGKLAADEVQASTFTITNPGLFGSVYSTPIINPPDAAILGLCRIAETPVAREGKVVIRLMTNLCLSYDHRIVDGETALKFLRRMRETLEKAAFDLE